MAQDLRAQEKPAGHLLIYAIDVEGGQSTLLVDAATHASLLVDTGWPKVEGHSVDAAEKGLHDAGEPAQTGRDAARIQAAMQVAGITRIDHVLITHFHTDHVGGVPELVRHVEIREFLDHGETAKTPTLPATITLRISRPSRASRAASSTPATRSTSRASPPLSSLRTASTLLAVPGVQPTPNPYCATEPHWDLDTTENPRSTGILIRFGKFRFLDLGDLTKAKEIPLVCPENLVGTVDLYLVNHHGFNLSNAHAFVDAIHPRAAIMDNGAHKAGSPEAWQTVHESLGLEDLWMLHTAEGSDAAHNSADGLIANLKGGSDGNFLKVIASPDGSFSITNSRTGQTKDYPRR